MPETTQHRASLETLRRALEESDATALVALYREDAELRIVDKEHPPSAPRLLRGKAAIAEYYQDVCGRAMSHALEQGVENGDRLAFSEACTYPDGSRVLCMALLELTDGKIARQTNVQAWDE